MYKDSKPYHRVLYCTKNGVCQRYKECLILHVRTAKSESDDFAAYTESQRTCKIEEPACVQNSIQAIDSAGDKVRVAGIRRGIPPD